MFKNLCAFALCCLLAIAASPSFIFGQTGTNNDDSAAAKIKANVQKRGVNEKKRVKVERLNGTSINGYITQIGDDSFEIRDAKLNRTFSIAYRDVERVKGGGLSGGARTAIIVGALAGAAAIVLAILIQPICNEGGC
jgi:hypothetical protein